MVRIDRYGPDAKQLWNEFISRSKNGVFLFQRNYMDYHADRFTDHSLLFFLDGRLIAVLPGNIREGTLCTHGGLTFGGIISDQRMKAATMLELFETWKSYLRGQGIARVIYKAIPHIYHLIPAEEDLYALFVHGARLVRRDISSTVWMKERLPLGKGRKWSAKRAKKNGVEVRQSRDFQPFMAIEKEHLQRKYGIRPTHTGLEMELLAECFPQNIKLFGAYRQDVLVGGMVIYESKQVAHAQYIAATDEGKELGAVDGILEFVLNEAYATLPYFDFGISTENQGRYLNAGLIANKESHGGRAIAYDSYEMEIGN